MTLLLAMMLIRVATYNVHSCRGLDFRMKPGRIARVIAQTRADVIALEEVRAEQAEAIARQLGLEYRFGVADVLGGHEFGNAILSRLPLSSSRNFNIGVPHREQRACLRVQIEPSGTGPFEIFAVHLGLSGSERRLQAARLASSEILGSTPAGRARVLLGDFNEWSNNGAVNRRLIAILQRVPKRSYPGLLPLIAFDRVYFAPEFSLRSLRLHRSWKAVIASDHVPLVADLEL